MRDRTPALFVMTHCSRLQVRVNESQVKNRLYMGNLPRSMTQLQLEDALKQELQGEAHRLEV
jgi:hypothetical protein